MAEFQFLFSRLPALLIALFLYERLFPFTQHTMSFLHDIYRIATPAVFFPVDLSSFADCLFLA